MVKWLIKYWPVLLLLLVFLAVRLPAINQIYHQDEHRWATQSDPTINDPSPHPPLTKYFLRATGLVFGFDHLKIGILLFAFLNAILVYFVSRRVSENKSALVSLFLFSISVYSAIASLQIDIDGAVLPFFVLLGYYAYFNLKTSKDENKKWWAVFIIAIAGGFLSKVSFIIFAGTLAADYLLDLRISDIRLFIRKYLKAIIAMLVLAVGGLYLYVKLQSGVVAYAEHFNSLNFASRAYFELGFKILKSFVWLSPLLLLSVVWGFFDKEIFKRQRFWFIYLGLNLIFYILVFDFAKLTVERYFMFWIVPAVIIAGDLIQGWLGRAKFKNYNQVFIASVLFIVLSLVILSANPAVLPLDPKTEYVKHVKSLDFNFLIPLTGGSGPVGFYFSASYILAIWLISAAALLIYSFGKRWKESTLTIFLVFGLGYNFLFLNEYLFGSIFGSVPNIAKASINYIINDPKIDRVITYYDIGAYNLKMGGKYVSRFYTAPARDYTEKLSTYKGYYLIVDFPSIDKNGRYWPYFDKCDTVKKFNDKKVDVYIFNC